jgi:hypothetical protein
MIWYFLFFISTTLGTPVYRGTLVGKNCPNPYKMHGLKVNFVFNSCAVQQNKTAYIPCPASATTTDNVAPLDNKLPQTHTPFAILCSKL